MLVLRACQYQGSQLYILVSEARNFFEMPTKHSSQALDNEYLEICVDMHLARPLPQNLSQISFINLKELLEVLRACEADLPLRVVIDDDILVIY